jgi:hypothetical protein
LSLRFRIDDMDRLRAGIALYNAGHYLAAHEPLEERWLERPPEDREDCLQGLIQATAAVHKSRAGNPEGATGLAESAVGYLGGCERIDVEPLSAWLDRLADDPELGTCERPPELRIDGDPVVVDGLRFPAAGIAARALAAVRDDEPLAAAAEYAEADLDAGEEASLFVTLTLDYVRGGDPLVARRLKEHVERRRMRESDVEGLF